MTRTILFATGMAVAASVAASTVVFAQDQIPIGNIAVTVEFEDVDANALQYWPNIATDLQAAIEARAMPYRASDGVDISVQLKEISLSGSRILSGTGEFNHLEGWAYFRRAGEDVPFDQESIVLDASTVQAGVSPEGIVVPGVPVFYSALIDGFAIATVDKLEP